MQVATTPSSSGSEFAGSNNSSPMERDLLIAHEINGGAPYSNEERRARARRTPKQQAQHIRGLRERLLETRCGGDKEKLVQDLRLYASNNGPAKLRQIWREREEGAENVEEVTIH